MASSSSILPRSRQSNSPALEQADQEGFPFHQSPNSVRPASVTSPKCTSFTSSTRSARDRTRFSPSSSPSRQESSTMFGTMTGEQLRQHHQQDHAQFAVKREALVNALDETTILVKSLAAFNQDKWTIHYPHQLGVATSPTSPAGLSPSTPASLQRGGSSPNTAAAVTRPDSVKRSMTISTNDDHDSIASSHESSLTRPAIPQRSISTNVTRAPAVDATPAHPLSILALDLKLSGQSSSVTSSPSGSTSSALLPSLSLQTLAHLLARRLASSLVHLSALKTRVTDTQSRILITGDLNAGKSTLVNALLRRQVMPVDQQPCTSVFAEVVDAKAWNDGREEVHAISDAIKYDPKDDATFDRFRLGEIERLMDEGHDDQDDSDEDFDGKVAAPLRSSTKYQLLKAYVNDARAPQDDAGEDDVEAAASNPSFIRNSLVSISLIDAPGLNRDTLSTTALFARQSEIDVVVFVVSAENHFTLSAKEFLWSAAQEKAYVFVVVNKWNGIRDKRRCMRVVGEQIRQLSPKTWDNREELVHFVDAADVFDDQGVPIPDAPEDLASEDAPGDVVPPSFTDLESALRTFVLLKRTTSKLAPARTYLLNLLADLSTLSRTNTAAAQVQLDRAQTLLDDVIKPVNDRLRMQRDEVEHGTDAVEESTVERVRREAWSRLESALAFVGRGELPASTTTKTTDEEQPATTGDLARPTALPSYPGLMNLWEWAADVKRVLVQALEVEIRTAEDEARVATSEGVRTVMDGLGNKYLPQAAAKDRDAATSTTTTPAPTSGAQRVFRPEVMFAKRRRGVGRLAAKGISSGLGLGTPAMMPVSPSSGNWSVTDFEVSFLDLFDLDRLLSHGHLLRLGGKHEKAGQHSDQLIESSAIWGLGLGSVGMLGSRIIGVKGAVDSVSRVLEILGSDSARKWAGPVIGVVTCGLVAYVIVDLPRAVPRNIGRKLRASLAANACDSETALTSFDHQQQPPTSFSTAHADRIARETRKVLRLAGWDLRERFRAALDRSEAERREVEAVLTKSRGALQWLEGFEKQVRDEKSKVQDVVVV